MDVCSQFVGRYKKDMSVENLRAKVARRKSITQKENRHKEFRKSRGLSVADVNVSLVKEQELTVVEEVNESCLLKGQENKPANEGKTREQIIKEERRAMLQRFKEEKQLRKLKEQREKASKVFRCGIYKPEGSQIPVFTSQTAAKVKQPKEKPPAPSVPRVTRSTLKMDPPANKTRSQVNVLTNKAPIDRAIPRGRGQTSVVKKNESKVSGIPSARTTRSAANAAGKASLKNPPAIKPQKKPLREISPEMVIDKTEPPVSDHSNERVQEPEPVLKDAHVESETLPETLPEEPERKPSFAPQNFVFQPLDGLSTFQFQPMTPNRANAFLTPSFTWSPQDGKRVFVVTREHNTDHKEDLQSPTEPSQTATEVKLEVELNASPQDAECACDANSSPQTSPAMTPPPCEPSSEDNKTTQSEEAPHDVPYFRSILKSEIKRLTLLSSDWDKRIDMDIPEDAKDLIRTTVGQTRLLMTERFKQFEGLVDNCEFKRGEKETTCTDLDGFWDMVYFQIEDVSNKFVNLGKLEENSWQQDTSQTKKVVKKKIAPAATVKQNQGDNGRAAARGRLAAIKAAMKNRIKVEAPCAELEAPVIPMHVDPIVFDAGFFRIESPAKLPGSLRTNRTSRSNTPKTTNETVQNFATPVPNGKENAADVKPEKSPSPVRKALFGVPEGESLQNQEPDPVLQSQEHTQTDSVPAEVDLTKYLAQAQTLSLGAEESPGLIKCLGLDASETQDGCDAEVDAETSMRVDDVFMCSPEKVAPETEASCLPETSEPGPDDEVKTTSDPLDFLGSCTPIMVKHTPMMIDSAEALTDLMTFSPMEQ